jgi:hypothetical protein
VARGRDVVHLSRSDPRRDPIWRGWWARVFLRTKLAGGEGPGRPLALAILYERRNGGFALVRLHTLGI